VALSRGTGCPFHASVEGVTLRPEEVDPAPKFILRATPWSARNPTVEFALYLPLRFVFHSRIVTELNRSNMLYALLCGVLGPYLCPVKLTPGMAVIGIRTVEPPCMSMGRLNFWAQNFSPWMLRSRASATGLLSL